MFYFVKYTPITLGDYQYPGWGEALGFMISGSSMIWVPGKWLSILSSDGILLMKYLLGYMIYYFFTTPGTWREVLRKGTTPVIVPRAEAVKCKELKDIRNSKEDVEQQLLEKNEKSEDAASSSSDVMTEDVQNADESVLLPTIDENVTNDV